jgi:DNA-binding response OmpR family regulator
MAKEKLLVVEDEESVLELVEYNLKKEGYRVLAAATGEDGLKAARKELPDLVLLDVMLPGLDGLDVCRVLKNDPTTSHIPVVMLTAKGEEADVVTGLELGADDYITKPFSVRVLLARVRAALRRKETAIPADTTTIRLRELIIHPGRHEVLARGERVELTYTEFRLLHLLARRAGWVFTRSQIVDAVRGEDHAVTERSVDVQIVGLRRKLGPLSGYIETVRGVGYRMKG